MDLEERRKKIIEQFEDIEEDARFLLTVIPVMMIALCRVETAEEAEEWEEKSENFLEALKIITFKE